MANLTEVYRQLIASAGAHSAWVLLLAVLFFALCFQLVLIRRLVRGSSSQLRAALQKLQDESRQTSDDLDEKIQNLHKSQEESWSETRRALGRIELRALPSATGEKSRGNGLDKKHHIVSLAQRGVKPGDISKRLKVYPGETELVLGLTEYFSNLEMRHERSAVQ